MIRTPFRRGFLMLIMGANFNDTVELWLEAIRYAGEEFHVEVLAGAISKPDLSQGSSDHILVLVERRSMRPRKRARPHGWKKAYRWR